jgi:hypothetical protein
MGEISGVVIGKEIEFRKPGRGSGRSGSEVRRDDNLARLLAKCGE